MKINKWLRMIWFAILGKQVIPTDRKDWSVNYGRDSTF
jgi:hypothetical protein